MAISSLLVWIQFSGYTGIALEDAFITYRYAQNLANGHGLVFNIGERVLGITSPLYAVLLGALGALFGPEKIPTLSASLMPMVGAAVAALLLVMILDGTRSKIAAVVGTLLFMLHPATLSCMTGGMETPLVLLFMVTSLVALQHKRFATAGILLALLVLTRIDGLVWGAALGAYVLLTSPRQAVRVALAATVILLPCLILAWLYYGSPVPHSLIAKRVIGPEWLFSEPMLSISRIKRYALWFIGGGLSGPHLLALSTILVGILRTLRTHRSFTFILSGFSLAYVAAFYFGSAPPDFEWYLMPFVLSTTALVGIGVSVFTRFATQPEAAKGLRTASACTAALVGVSLLAHAGVQADKAADRVWVYQGVFETNLHIPLGQALKKNTSPEASIAMEAIGYQGYYSERHVIDLTGLVSPEVVAIRRSSKSNGEAFRRVLEQHAPDLIVLASFQVDENTHAHGGPLFDTDADRAYFDAHYAESGRMSSIMNYSRLAHLTIFERRTQVTEADTGVQEPSLPAKDS